MAATPAMIATVRRYVADVDADLFDDQAIADAIERYPFADADGLGPQDAAWTPRYDLNAAAADLWMERAARATGQYDFSTIEGRFDVSQVQQQAERMAAFYRKRIAPRWVQL